MLRGLAPYTGALLRREFCGQKWFARSGLGGIGDSECEYRMSLQLSPESQRRIRNEFSKLIWDHIRPWAYLETDGVEVRTFDGRVLRYCSKTSAGAELALWDNHIEPFLKDLCRVEIAATTNAEGSGTGPMVYAIRNELVLGFIRTYWTLADVHRQTWPLSNGVERRDTSEEVSRMVAFLETCVQEVLKKNRAYSLSGLTTKIKRVLWASSVG